jgi:uncharacterized protein YegP (UPF0339 family)
MGERKCKFEFWKSMGGLWFFHLLGKNGKVLLQSEAYTTKSKALKGIEAIREGAAAANIVQCDWRDGL